MATPTPIGVNWADVWKAVWLEVWSQSGALPTPVATLSEDRNTASLVRRLKAKRRS